MSSAALTEEDTHPRHAMDGHGKKDGAELRKRLLGALIMPFFIAFMYPLVFSGANHHTQPRHMNIAIVGTEPASHSLTQQLETSLGDKVDLRELGSLDEGKRQVRDREIRAVYDADRSDLYVASAGGRSAKSTAVKLFTPVADQQHKKLDVHDLVPTAKHDTMAMSPLYLSMGVIIGGLAAGLFTAMIGQGMKPWIQAAPLIGTPILLAALEVLFGWVFFDLYDGSWFKPGCIIFLLGLVSALFTWGGVKLIGPLHVPLSVLTLVLLGVTGSGVATPLDMALAFYDVVHTQLPAGRGISALRDAIYFHHVNVGWDLVIMGLWGAVGLMMALVAHLIHRDTSDAVTREAVIEEAAAATAAGIP